jgi:hypothetical protein
MIAQQADAGTGDPGDDIGDAAPSVRMSALRAYSVARDSTVEYLSPTPFYDLRV